MRKNVLIILGILVVIVIVAFGSNYFGNGLKEFNPERAVYSHNNSKS